MAIAVEVAAWTEGVVPGVQQPPAETRAVGRHHRGAHGRSRLLQHTDTPRARDEYFGPTIAVIVGWRAKMIVRGIEQPAAETRAIGRHHRRRHRGAGLFEETNPPRAGDQDLGAPVTVIVRAAGPGPHRGWDH